MANDPPRLQRRLSLPLLVLYGTGVTVGAGIYVLVGTVAGHAGKYAPLSFLMAAVVMALTVTSYAELCTRFPVAAGEAAYVKGAFRSRILSTATGIAMIGTAVIASATVALGAAGYLAVFVDLPRPLVACVVVLLLGAVSAWGVVQSVLLASLFTLVELSGLIAIIVTATYAGVPIGESLFSVPAINSPAWVGISFGSVLAFFAFIGFEDLTNMIEETRAGERNIPFAMAATLIATTVLYVLIAAIAVTAVPLELLSARAAPLSVVFHELTGVGPSAIAAIAIVATLNTIIAEITMATRVIYGMANLGDLPPALSAVNEKTSTPLMATAVIVALVMTLVLFAPIERLAETTSLLTLAVFVIVNLALLKLRWAGAPSPGLRVPILAPLLGLLTSLAMIAGAFLER
jgi:APA family basic amino acid/polyamine antiporter